MQQQLTPPREPKGIQKAQPQPQVSYSFDGTALLAVQQQEQTMTHARVASPYVTQTTEDMTHASSACCVAPRQLQMGCIQQ